MQKYNYYGGGARGDTSYKKVSAFSFRYQSATLHRSRVLTAPRSLSVPEDILAQNEISARVTMLLMSVYQLQPTQRETDEVDRRNTRLLVQIKAADTDTRVHRPQRSEK